MKFPQYAFSTEENRDAFRFTSVGPKGEIKKIVLYSRTGINNVYNLAFGDYNGHNDDLDDLSVSDNRDTQKILATIASTFLVFIENHPKAWVLAEGSTKARTRLYRIGISQNLTDISSEFAIFGYMDPGGWQPFNKNTDYMRFMITSKQNLQHYED